MAYNHGREDRKWRIWKEAEEKLLRECGVDEATIEQIRMADRADFNSNRRFYRWTNDVAEYLEDMADRERQAEVNTVAELLDEIESENLYQVLVTVDGRTLKIVLLKMQGYSTKEIAPLVHLTTGAIYARLDHLRKKLRKILYISYMGFQPGEPLLGKKVDYVFLGACTNGRIEDFRAFASIVKGRRKAENVVAWLVPGSWMVDAQIREEGLDKILEEAGFAIRQPGCSACLAMNDDKVPAGKYAVSTSNRNFEGRQGPGSRTLLASPLVAAAAAVTGVITDPRTLI